MTQGAPGGNYYSYYSQQMPQVSNANQISPQVYHNVDPNASFVSSNGDSTRTSTPMMIMGNVIPQDQDIWKQWAVQQTTANSTPPEWKWMTCRCGRNSTDTPMR
ncbi:hypothetical protein L596_020746 [Steinernema carpocapsae]|uniref:Uncharacterized protein n=1 Tax=Steinernema carpocapsae TaxID=34508 RepID=A0A4U5MUF8_STECR|nr:hypothetical protein L596_020746 [Steinernema carpocapsae]